MDKSVKPYSLQNMLNLIGDNFAILFIVGLFFLGGFFSGSLWTQNQMLTNGTGTNVAAGTGTAAAPDTTAPAGPTVEQLKSVAAVSDADYVRGNKDAKVTLLEFSDFECTFCARFHPTMNEIMAEYGDKVRWVYRHYPLSFHPNAQKGAEASECVAKQKGSDGFWKYADAIFEENTKMGGQISPAAIETAAQAAGVNLEQFKTCLDSGEMAAKVKAHLDEGTKAGVNGTPGTIVMTDDGQVELIPGAYSTDQVKAIIDKYL